MLDVLFKELILNYPRIATLRTEQKDYLLSSIKSHYLTADTLNDFLESFEAVLTVRYPLRDYKFLVDASLKDYCDLKEKGMLF